MTRTLIIFSICSLSYQSILKEVVSIYLQYLRQLHSINVLRQVETIVAGSQIGNQLFISFNILYPFLSLSRCPYRLRLLLIVERIT